MVDLHLAERWAKRFVPRPAARLRLFCFPYAGAGASAFRRLCASLPEGAEVRPIEYPGRWTRVSEAPCDSVAALADGAAEALAPLLDVPFAVLGYSLGALVAYEWIRRLERAAGPRPRLFVACAQRSPHLPSEDRPLHLLDDDALLAALEARYGAGPGPAILDAEMRRFVMPPLRADLRARETYRHEPGPPLETPIRAWGGRRDASVPVAALEAWRERTRADFALRLFEGGHFFVADDAEALRAALADALIL